MSGTKFPYLRSLSGAIDQLHHETEAEAKQLIEKDLAAARNKKDEVMGTARRHIESHKDAISEIGEELDKVAEDLDRSNSGDRRNPT